MSYQERRTIVSLITGILVMVAYYIYAFGRYQSGAVDAGDLKFWAGAILTFVAVGIVASIIVQIVFHILMSIGIAVTKKMRDEEYDDKEIEKQISAEMVEDEMHKLIELKSLRVGFVIAGIGFVVSLVLLVLGYSPVVMLNVLFFAFFGGSVMEGITQLYFYRKGVANG